MRKNKPDLLMVLVVFVVAGVMMTTLATSWSSSEVTQNTLQPMQQHAMNDLRP